MNIKEALQSRRAEQTKFKPVSRDHPHVVSSQYVEENIGYTFDTEIEDGVEENCLIVDRYHSEKAVVDILRRKVSIPYAVKVSIGRKLRFIKRCCYDSNQ